jgi:formamidopyrimidine-DNA glycosylase
LESEKKLIEWTKEDIERATKARDKSTKEVLSSASESLFKRYDEDKAHQYRMHEQTCKYCRYLKGRMALQSFWTWYCSKCGDQGKSSSSAHPTWCVKCAEEMGICSHCGAKMN